MADDDFRFKIDADISSASNNIKSLKEEMDSLQKLAQRSHMNADYLPLGQINKALDKVRELNNAYSSLQSTINSLNVSSKGGTAFTPEQNQQLAYLQQQANDYHTGDGAFYGSNNIKEDVFRSRFTNNAGLNAYIKYNNAQTDEVVDQNNPLSSVRGTLQSLDNWKQDTHLMSRRQSLRYGQATANGRMSQATLNAYNRDNDQALDRFGGYGNSLNDALGYARGRIKDANDERTSLARNTDMDDESRAKQIAVQNDIIRQNEQLVDKLKRFNDELNNTTNTLKKDHDDLAQNSALKITPSGGVRGYFNRRASSIVYRSTGRMIGALQGQEAAGQALNSQTDDQSINLAYATGSGNDQAIRDQLFNVNQRWGNGYGLSDSLNLYQYALMRQGYSGGGLGQTSSMVNAMELGGNNTGIGRSEYQNFAGTVAAGGGLNNTGDVNRINNAVTGMNVYGGTMGLQQQQAQTLTQLVQQIGQQRVISSQDTANIAGVEGILARDGGRQLQGQQGQQAMGQLNGAFLNASEGNNDRLVQLMRMSNPTKYGGGLQGYNKAEGELSKGLASSENINLAAEMSNAYGGANGGAVVLQNMFGVKSHQAAQKLSELFQNGDLSQSERDKAVAKIEKEGNSKRASNQSTYNGSSTATRNASASRLERIDSQTDSAYQQTIGKILANMDGLPTFMTTVGTGVKEIVAYLAFQGIASKLGDYIKGATERTNGGGSGGSAGEGEEGGGGFAGGGGGGWFSKTRDGIKGRINKYADEHEHVGALRDKYRSARGSISDRVSGWKGKISDWSGGRLFKNVHASGEAGEAEDAVKVGSEAVSAGEGLAKSGLLSKAGRVLGRGNDLMLVGTTAISAYNDLKSKHPVANLVKDGGGLAGGLAGGSAGAEGGALLGTAIFPGVGTVAGGIIGGVGGSILGSGLGSWASGKVVDGWNALTGQGKSRHSRSASHKADEADYTTGNTEYQNITKTDANNRHKKENLNTQAQQLEKAQSLLNQSRAQNGIMGKSASTSTAIAGINSGNANGDKAANVQNKKSAKAVKKGLGLLGHVINGVENPADEVTKDSLGLGKKLIGKLTQHHKKVANDVMLNNLYSPSLSSGGTKGGNNTFNVSLNMHGTGNSKEDGKKAATSFMATIKQKMQDGIDNNSSNYTVINSGNDMPWA